MATRKPAAEKAAPSPERAAKKSSLASPAKPGAAGTGADKPAAAKRTAAPKAAGKAPAKTVKATTNAGAGKAATASASKAAAKTAAKPSPAEKSKPKLVRDSFTMPKLEYAVIDSLKQRAARLGRPAKKSEVLRAGVKALEALSDQALLAALQAVPTIKTGRPGKA